MLSLLKKLFGVKPVEQPVEVAYKVEAANQVSYKEEPEAPVTTPIPLVAEVAPVVVKQQPKKRPARRKSAGSKTAQQPAQKQSASKQNVAKQAAPKKPKSQT
jgi:hypothetical protein